MDVWGSGGRFDGPLSEEGRRMNKFNTVISMGEAIKSCCWSRAENGAV